jgi:hypothetical protein
MAKCTIALAACAALLEDGFSIWVVSGKFGMMRLI